jgi:hypothetical protein
MAMNLLVWQMNILIKSIQRILGTYTKPRYIAYFNVIDTGWWRLQYYDGELQALVYQLNILNINEI